jgi:hypothetical protein
MLKKQAKTDLASKSSIGHWGRVAVMVLSGGFIYPNAMTEYDDIVIKPDIGNAATVKNK